MIKKEPFNWSSVDMNFEYDCNVFCKNCTLIFYCTIFEANCNIIGIIKRNKEKTQSCVLLVLTSEASGV